MQHAKRWAEREQARAEAAWERQERRDCKLEIGNWKLQIERLVRWLDRTLRRPKT